ncbi:MAG: hypothetical protein AAF802_01195 [Planctomycetota bacterium]
MKSAMMSARGNTVTYIVSFWNAIEELRSFGVDVPSVEIVNGILRDHDIPFRISPPDLELLDGDLESPQDGDSRPTPIYTRESIIWQGGFGTVYLVTRDTSVGSFIHAMKVFSPSVFNPNPQKALK